MKYSSTAEVTLISVTDVLCAMMHIVLTWMPSPFPERCGLSRAFDELIRLYQPYCRHHDIGFRSKYLVSCIHPVGSPHRPRLRQTTSQTSQQRMLDCNHCIEAYQPSATETSLITPRHMDPARSPLPPTRRRLSMNQDQRVKPSQMTVASSQIQMSSLINSVTRTLNVLRPR